MKNVFHRLLSTEGHGRGKNPIRHQTTNPGHSMNDKHKKCWKTSADLLSNYKNQRLKKKNSERGQWERGHLLKKKGKN